MNRASKVVARIATGLVVAVVAAFGLTACAAAVSNTASTVGKSVIAPGALGGAFTSDSTPTAERLLAASGVATVASESSHTPVTAVKGNVVLEFTVAQVRSMALQASDHGGILGSALDGATATPSGVPPISYLLAAWALKGTSPGAVAVRRMLGTQDWTNAPNVLFPTIALTLFTADVAGALPHTASAVSKPGGSEVMASAVTGPCSLVSNFIQDTLATVFNALTLTAPSGTGIGSTIGSFFVSIWNEAVSLAQQAVQGLITAVTAGVVQSIASISGAVAVIAELSSYLSPWSVAVTASPTSLAGGASGSFKATVDSGTSGASYPSAVVDCAGALNITLPKLDSSGADATWALGGPIHASSATGVTLDSSGATTISYDSDKSSADACGSSGHDAAGTARLTVKRPAIDDLKNLATTMLSNGLGTVGSIVSPIVQSILEPLISEVVDKLDTLTQVTGTGSVVITGETATQCSASPTPSASPDASNCLVGTWKSTGQALNGAQRGGGGVTYVFSANGTGTENYAGSAPVQSIPAGNNIQYSGTSTIKISNITHTSATGGSLTSTILSTTVTATSSGGHVSSLPSGVSAQLGWTCQGNTSTLTANLGGELEVYTLVRQ